MIWLKKLIPSLGLLMGIIFVAIGAVMLVSSSLKLIFHVQVTYDDPRMCMYVFDPVAQKDVLQTDTQIETCRNLQKDQQDNQFFADKMNTIIDGVAFLAVGTFFWIFFWKRRELS